MIKYLSLDLQGTLSSSEFSDYFWCETIPKKYAEKYNISVEQAKENLKKVFKEYGVYDIHYYDDSYWEKSLTFNVIEELKKSSIKPKINKELLQFIENISIPKIIISTTTKKFINYELGEKRKLFQKIYSCVDDFNTGGKTANIYKEVAKQLNVKTNEILHIGDNKIMDIENAKKSGINAILFEKGKEKQIIEVIKQIIKEEEKWNMK